jgi:hypothetical protein
MLKKSAVWLCSLLIALASSAAKAEISVIANVYSLGDGPNGDSTACAGCTAARVKVVVASFMQPEAVYPQLAS